jgi:hypothetical protein
MSPPVLSKAPSMISLDNIEDFLEKYNQKFMQYFIYLLIGLILIVYFGYIGYQTSLNRRNVNYMNTLYSSVDSNILPITSNNSDFSNNLCNYYIKTAYNACSGGSYKNDWVDSDNLRAVIKQGVRCLDFEIYSVNNNPVVATSTTSNNYVKETFNYVPFQQVMSTISTYAFATGSCPNYTDPILIHLRIKSTNQTMYTNLANIFETYDNLMLGSEYSFENSGESIAMLPLLTFQKKIVLIVDKLNTSFLENQAFLEYVNLTSNSVFMRALNYEDVKNNPDVVELTNFNKPNMTIVLPDSAPNPPNPSGILCRHYGCQMVAMRYQYVDSYLEENALFFDEYGYAFCLKPEELRYYPIVIDDPTPQNPAYSYATRNVTTDYYNYNF